MSDEQVTFSGTEQLGAPAERQQPEKQPQPEMIPADKVAEVVATQVAAALDKWNREQQGLRRKAQNRITQEVKDQLSALRSAGVEVTDQQAQVIERQTRARIEAEFDPGEVEPPAPQKAAPAEPKKQAAVDEKAEYVRTVQARIFKKYGVLAKSDPEAEGLAEIADPDEYLDRLEERCKQKQARVATSPDAKVPTLLFGSNTSKEALVAELEKLLVNPTNNMKRIREIKAKLKE